MAIRLRPSWRSLATMSSRHGHQVAAVGSCLGIFCVFAIGYPIWADAPLTAVIGMLIAGGLVGAALLLVIVYILEAL